MLTIHIVQSGSNYEIEGANFGDEEGLAMYLRARGVSRENVTKALEELVEKGEYTIDQE